MKKMTALQRDREGLCKVVDLATMDGISRTSETAEIRGWGKLDGSAEVWRAESGAYEMLIPVRSLAASEMGRSKTEAKAEAARENSRKGWTTVGPVRGCCGHLHRSEASAEKCVEADSRSCGVTGGYSDRSVLRAHKEKDGTLRIDETLGERYTRMCDEEDREDQERTF